MKRISLAVATMLMLTACGDKMDDPAATEELRPLDPNPPLSASDIDSIVKETRERDAARGGGATPPTAENASNTN